MNREARRLLRDRSGVAAVEFALLAPFLILLFLGFAETYLYARSVAAMERTAFSLADLVARRSLVCQAKSSSDPNSVNTYLTAAKLIAEPLSLETNGMVILTAAVKTGAAGAVVAWQVTSGYTLKGVSSAVGKPGGPAALAGGITLGADGDTAIVAEVFYLNDWYARVRHFWPSAPVTGVLSRAGYYRARIGSLATLYTAATNANCPP